MTLHWVMAVLILFMIWLGHNMHNHEVRFQLHKSHWYHALSIDHRTYRLATL